VVKLIGHIYDAQPKKSLKCATTEALKRCDGTWGMCIMSKDNPDELVVACNGSPLVIGLGRKATYVASEPSAFNRFTKEFISMKDGEIGLVHADGRELDLARVERAPDLDIQLSPAPHPHWTVKECFEQPEAVARALAYGSRLGENVIKLGGLDNHEKKLATLDHMTLSACGTSLHAAQYGARLMKKIHAFQTVQTLDSAETKHHDLQNSSPSNSGVIVVSQSGETKDVHRVVLTAQSLGLTVISVVNSVGSLIARTTKLGVYLNAGRENAVASTKAFTTQVTVLALVAVWFREAKDRLGVTRNSDGAGKQPFHTSQVKEVSGVVL
jgi:glucosamine--fructose-6-phosphate aminotransferase (isomerizing)